MHSELEVDFHQSGPIMWGWELYATEVLTTRLEKELPVMTGKTPNSQQWEMIKARENNVCVWAGAGSGKTLSLIWRVVFLHVYLKIPLNEITVLSFTRKSVEEFREKLIDMLEKFDNNINADDVSKSVRTFHSKILDFGKQSNLAASSDKIFEHLRDPKDIQGSSEFTVSQFKTENKSVDRLCKAIGTAGYDLGTVSANENTIAWLNEVLQMTDFLERLSLSARRLSPPDEIRELKEQTREYRGKIYEYLPYNDQAAIKRLNRLLIELLHPDETPKLIIDNDEEEMIDQIFNKGKIPPKQSWMLKDTYSQLFQLDPLFKDLVIKLYAYHLSEMSLYNGKKYDKNDRFTIQLDACLRDKELTTKVHRMLKSKFKCRSVKKFQINNLDNDIFYANGYVAELDLYLVFIPDNNTLGQLYLEPFGHPLPWRSNRPLTLRACLTIKERVLHSFSNKNIRVIHNQNELNIFDEQITIILSDLASNNAPAFEFALAGDISKNNIWELFFKSGNFIENSGLNVDKIKDCIHEYKLDEPDRLFLQALVIYWPYFC